MTLKRVTHLIKEHRLCGNDYAYVDVAVLNKAAERGNYIHARCELYHSNDKLKAQQAMFFEQPINPEWMGFWDAYVRFVFDVGWEPKHFELELKGAYVGHVDQIGSVLLTNPRQIVNPTSTHARHGTVVLEVKTAVPLPSHRVQLSAYWYLYEQIYNDPTAESWLLYLKANGKYKLVVIDALERREHITAFLGALHVDMWREKYIKDAKRG